MGKILDLTGQRFGRLVAIDRGPNKGKERAWRCACDCGGFSVVRVGSLRCGNSTSCGCMKAEAVVRRNTKHGLTPRNAQKPRLYRIWKGMRQRCNDQNAQNYAYYGGRGIAICSEWDDFARFDAWARDAGYTDDLLLDRENNAEGYSPQNCRWVTRKTQMRNTRANHLIWHDGALRTIAEVAEITGAVYSTLVARAGRAKADAARSANNA